MKTTIICKTEEELSEAIVRFKQKNFITSLTFNNSDVGSLMSYMVFIDYIPFYAEGRNEKELYVLTDEVNWIEAKHKIELYGSSPIVANFTYQLFPINTNKVRYWISYNLINKKDDFEGGINF